jgi:hypothetical protein
MTPHGHADRLADPGGRAGNKRALSPQLTPIPEVRAEPSFKRQTQTRVTRHGEEARRELDRERGDLF